MVRCTLCACTLELEKLIWNFKVKEDRKKEKRSLLGVFKSYCDTCVGRYNGNSKSNRYK